jgi:hypothetical protein
VPDDNNIFSVKAFAERYCTQSGASVTKSHIKRIIFSNLETTFSRAMAQFFKEHRPLFLATLISLFMIPLIWKYAMLSDVPRLEKSRDEINLQRHATLHRIRAAT